LDSSKEMDPPSSNHSQGKRRHLKVYEIFTNLKTAFESIGEMYNVKDNILNI
jgi:hypothetical protein